MGDGRFHGKIGEKLEISGIGIPHREKFQSKIQEEIKRRFKDSTLNEISILEIGCGVGRTTRNILEADERIKVMAVDNEPIVLSQARLSLEEFIRDCRVKLATCDALEFLEEQKASSFSAFASAQTLHNFRRKYRERVITEIYRVLEPEGLFINADKYALDDETEHQKSLDWQLKKFEESYTKIDRPDLAAEWTKHYLEDNKPGIIMKESESKKAMERVGFKDIETVFREQMDAVMVAKKYGK